MVVRFSKENSLKIKFYVVCWELWVQRGGKKEKGMGGGDSFPFPRKGGSPGSITETESVLSVTSLKTK